MVRADYVVAVGAEAMRTDLQPRAQRLALRGVSVSHSVSEHTTGVAQIKWSPRVPRQKIQRLYESDANGLLNEELVDDIGITLYLRVRDILTIFDALNGRVRCPVCQRKGAGSFIPRDKTLSDPKAEVLTCIQCKWSVSWGQYAKSFQKKQLNPGGAVKFFKGYIAEYEAARTPTAKFLAIDLLIHEFHYSLASRPNHPTRPASVNLLEGQMKDIVPFLDRLTYGPHLPPEVKMRQEVWRAKFYGAWNEGRDGEVEAE